MCLFSTKLGRNSAFLIFFQSFSYKLQKVFVASLSLALRTPVLCSLFGLLLQLVLLSHQVKEVSCYGPNLLLRESLSLGLSKVFLHSLLQLSHFFRALLCFCWLLFLCCCSLVPYCSAKQPQMPLVRRSFFASADGALTTLGSRFSRKQESASIQSSLRAGRIRVQEGATGGRI